MVSSKLNDKKIRIAIALIPVIYGFLIVCIYGINQPYWDDWNALRYYFKYREGSLCVRDFLENHNGHCLFFPNAILTLVAILTNANLKVDMYVEMVMISIIYLIWVRRFASKCSNNKSFLLGIIIAGAGAYNSIQYVNFLWGFQMGFALTALMMLLTVTIFCTLGERDIFWHIVAIFVCGIIATFSSAQGVLALLTISFWCILETFLNKKIKNYYWMIWLASAVLLYVYMTGYTGVGTSASSGVLSIASFFLALVGAVCGFRDARLAIVFGLVVTVIVLSFFVYDILHRIIDEYSFEYCVLIMAYLTMGAMALGRAYAGPQYAAQESRYTTFSIWIYLALALLIIRHVEKWNLKRLHALPFLMALFFLGINVIFFRCYTHIRSFREDQLLITENYKKMSLDRLFNVYAWDNYEDAYADLERYYKYTGKDYEESYFGLCDLSTDTNSSSNMIWGIQQTDFVMDDKLFYLKSGYVLSKENEIEDVFVTIGDKTYRAYYGEYTLENEIVYGRKYRYTGVYFGIDKNDVASGDSLRISAVMKDGTIESIDLGNIDI